MLRKKPSADAKMKITVKRFRRYTNVVPNNETQGYKRVASFSLSKLFVTLFIQNKTNENTRGFFGPLYRTSLILLVWADPLLL